MIFSHQQVIFGRTDHPQTFPMPQLTYRALLRQPLRSHLLLLPSNTTSKYLPLVATPQLVPLPFSCNRHYWHHFAPFTWLCPTCVHLPLPTSTCLHPRPRHVLLGLITQELNRVDSIWFASWLRGPFSSACTHFLTIYGILKILPLVWTYIHLVWYM